MDSPDEATYAWDLNSGTNTFDLECDRMLSFVLSFRIRNLPDIRSIVVRYQIEAHVTSDYYGHVRLKTALINVT